jgi:hypothetical protein
MCWRGINIFVFSLIAASIARAQLFKFDPDWLNSGSGPTTFPSISSSLGGSSVTASGIFSTTEETLEWMAADAPIIFVATVVDVRERSPSVNTVTVLESIKGDVPAGATLNFELPLGADPCHRGDRALFFLSENKLSVLFRYKARSGRSAIILRSRQVACMDRSVLTKPEEIIDAVRSASKFTVDPTKKPILLSWPIAFGTRTLVVPPDQRVEKLAHIWAASSSLDDRVVALRALRHFKSDYNISLAQRFLSDTRTRTAGGQGKWQMGFYPVRAEANNLLDDWNIPHPQLSDTGPVYIYEPLAFSRSALLWPAGLALLVIGLAILRHRGHRLLVFWSIAIFATAAILCLSLLWKRSISTVDEIMFSSKDAHHELASHQGALQYQVVREWSLPPRVVHGSFDLKLQDDLWSAAALNPVVTRQFAGFMSGHGQVVGPASVIHPFTLFRLPYSILIVPFTIVLIHQMNVLRRQLRRRRLGLCRNCGYDLRANPSRKCPECGVDTPSGDGSKTGQEVAIGGHAVGM